ncbi:MAG: hypothetical protein UIQ67_02365 [Bacteroidales bacterium]|nr:hypothetical protein [Bacteroidales bacterium]
MRSLFFILIAVFCGFSFVSCEEEDTDYSYFIKTDYPEVNSVSFHDIVIFERDKYGDKIRRRDIKEMDNSDLSQEFITEDNTTEIDIYYKITRFGQTSYGIGGETTTTWDKKKDNIVYLGSSGHLTEQEYNEYINQ